MLIDKEIEMPERVRLSRFCSIFTRADTLCLYHSLGLSPIYLNRIYQPTINSLKGGNVLLKDVLNNPGLKNEKIKNHIADLLEKRFVVPWEYDEGKELKSIQKQYLGQPHVSLMYLLLTDICNLACSYCFVKNNIPNDYQYSQMSPAIAQQAVKFFTKQIQLSQAKDSLIIFYGGEPLLNQPGFKSAVEKIEEMKKSGELPSETKMSLITNGTLMTSETARFIRVHQIAVSVSLDGPKHLTSYRVFPDGKRAHRQAIKGLKILQKEKIKPGISCTLGEIAIDRFGEILKWLTNQKVEISNVGFNMVRPTPRFPVSPDYAQRIADILIQGYDCLKRHGIYEDRTGRKVKNFVEGKIYPYDCGGCGNQIVVSPTGEVGVCAGFLGTKKYFMTDVFDSAFDHRKDQTFLLWSNRSPLSTEECFDCPALGLCGGGCPYSAEINRGNLPALDDVFCPYAKKVVEYLIWSLYDRHLQ